MRFRNSLLIISAVLVAFGGGMMIGTVIKREPDAVTMAAPDVQEEIIVQKETVIPSATPYIAEVISVPDKKEYLLMLSGESVCIYALREDGLTDLIQKTTVDTMQLRQEDYESLCKGITVDSLEEAKSLCEDFGG